MLEDIFSPQRRINISSVILKYLKIFYLPKYQLVTFKCKIPVQFREKLQFFLYQTIATLYDNVEKLIMFLYTSDKFSLNSIN